MEIADVAFKPGAGFRICGEADDSDAEAAGEAPAIATLRRLLTRQAREAQALADAAMVGGWARPVQPVHVEPMAAPRPSSWREARVRQG